MSNTYFDYDPDLYITAGGSLGKAMRMAKKNDLSSSITSAIEVFKQIDDLYAQSVSNDGRIVGTERTELLNIIDILFNLMVLIWKNLDGSGGDTHIKIENKQVHFLLNIHESNGLWKGSGRLTPIMVKPAKNFKALYTGKLSPEVVNFLKTYKEACEDNTIDEKEKEDLRKGIRQVLYYTLFLRLQIEKCLIDV